MEHKLLTSTNLSSPFKTSSPLQMGCGVQNIIAEEGGLCKDEMLPKMSKNSQIKQLQLKAAPIRQLNPTTKIICIVGCTHAGTIAAVTLRAIRPDYRVVVIEKDASNVSFLSCGIHLAKNNTCTDLSKMFYNSAAGLIKQGVQMISGSAVSHVDFDGKRLFLQQWNEESGLQRDANQDTTTFDTLPYDQLLLCVGSTPRIPKIIENINYSGDYLQQLRASKRILLCKNYSDAKKIVTTTMENVLIIGAGLIGMELAWAIQVNGAKVIVMDHGKRPLGRYFSDEYLDILETECEENDIQIWPEARMVKMSEQFDCVLVTVERNVGGQVRMFQGGFDTVVICSGFGPNTQFLNGCQNGPARTSGILQVDNAQRTSLENVYAAGDCAFNHFGVFDKPVYLPLATNAVRGALAAAHQIAGNQLQQRPTNASCAVQLFDYSLAATGLLYSDAKKFFPQAQRTVFSDFLWHRFCGRQVEKVVQPERFSSNFDRFGQIIKDLADMSVDSVDLDVDKADEQLVSQMFVYDGETRRILGAQVMGKQDITQLVNACSVAISQKINIDEIAQLDFGGFDGEQKPWGIMQIAAGSASLSMPNFEAFDEEG